MVLDLNMIIIKNKLEKVYDLDQTYRQETGKLISSGQLSKEEYEKLYDSKFKKIDDQNIKVVCDILDKYGFIEKERIGYKASYAQYLVIQHAPHEIKLKYQSVIEEAVNNGKLSRSDYAHFVDRVLVEEGKKQIYGTQYKFDEKSGKYELEPIENNENINEIRKEMGLPSFEEDASVVNRR